MGEYDLRQVMDLMLLDPEGPDQVFITPSGTALYTLVPGHEMFFCLVPPRGERFTDWTVEQVNKYIQDHFSQ